MGSSGHDIRISPKKKWSWGIDEPVFVEGRFDVKRAKRG
jgi:pyridoxamine 5'-phosphate oxidase family protein